MSDGTASDGTARDGTASEPSTREGDERLRVLRPEDAPLGRLPRWPLVAFAASVAAYLLHGLTGLSALEPVRFAAGLAAAGAGCALAARVEARFFRAASRLPAGLRFAVWLAVPPASLVGGLIVSALLEALLPEAAAGGVASFGLPFSLWFSSAALGSLSVLGIDVVVSAVVQRFRNRIIAAVLLLLSLVTGSALLVLMLGLRVFELVRKAPENVNLKIDGRGAEESIALLLRWLDEHPYLSLLAFTSFFAVLALPAVLSAVGKLADAVMERVHPLSLAFSALAEGDRAVRVEEKGSSDFIEVSRRFNQMVAALSLAERMERAFGVYVSPQVMGRIKAQHGQALLPASSRVASVFFADIRGFTSMSEKLPAEDVVRVLNRYFERAVDVIAAHEGYLNKFIGDAVVVVFNGPIDQPDHAARAVRCANALLERLEEMNQRGAFPEVGRLEVGIGVATGPMVAGNIGGSRQMEYTVIGDTVNLASRLCGQAPAGEVWVNQACKDGLSEGAFHEALEPISVKGKEKPVAVFRVWPRPPASA